MSAVIPKPDFSQYSIWKIHRGRQAGIDRIKELTGEAISMNEITLAVWPGSGQESKIEHGHKGKGRAVTFSDRGLIEWRWRVNQGLES
jgi:hypothetical protein